MQFTTLSSKAVAVVAAASGLYSGAEAYETYGHTWEAPSKDAGMYIIVVTHSKNLIMTDEHQCEVPVLC
jgi:hypothetical protein